MPVMRTYQCPECEGIFEYLHLRVDDLPPSFCPLCGASTSDVEPEVSSPHITKSIGKTADGVYRAMEEGSQARAAMAAEASGASVEDMSAMRITDMKDNAREGETAVASADNAVSQFMASTHIGGMQSAEAGAQFAATTNTGPYARAGAAAAKTALAGHSQRAQQVVAAGQMGRYTGA